MRDDAARQVAAAIDDYGLMLDLGSAVGAIDSVTLAAVAVMALAGLVVGLAPGSYPLAAVAVGFAAGDGGRAADPRRPNSFWLSLGYVLGIITIDAALGALFGFVGFMVLGVLVAAMVYAYFGLSVLLVISGLALLRVIRLRFRLLAALPRSPASVAEAYGLGLLFGLTTCPACTPLILPILISASTTGDPLMGGVLLLVFGIGRSVPILIAGVVAGFLGQLTELMFVALWFDRTVGVLLLVAATWFAYQGAIYAGWLALGVT